MNRLSLLIFILAFASTSFCQNNLKNEVRNYDIKLAGVKIGSMVAEKKQTDTVTVYTLDSKVSFWFFVTVEVHHQTYVVYHGDKLISSNSKSVSNKGTFTSQIVWDKDHYNVDVSSYKYGNKKAIMHSIQSNVVTLYFSEPFKFTHTLADGFGVMAPVKSLQAGIYEVDVLGNKNKYYYKNGKLQSASMYSKFKNYEVVLKKNED